MAERLPELFFGLVSPVGADSEGLVQQLTNELAKVGYTPRVIRLIESLPESQLWPKFDDEDIKARYNARMDAGNKFRKIANECLSFATDLPAYFSGNAAFGLLATLEIQRARQDCPMPGQGSRGVAYILRSLKREEEVEFLRKVYGRSFFVIAAYSGKERRTTRLKDQIQHTSSSTKPQSAIEADAEALVASAASAKFVPTPKGLNVWGEPAGGGLLSSKMAVHGQNQRDRARVGSKEATDAYP